MARSLQIECRCTWKFSLLVICGYVHQDGIISCLLVVISALILHLTKHNFLPRPQLLREQHSSKSLIVLLSWFVGNSMCYCRATYNPICIRSILAIEKPTACKHFVLTIYSHFSTKSECQHGFICPELSRNGWETFLCTIWKMLRIIS